jgi:hypothetical protein
MSPLVKRGRTIVGTIVAINILLALGVIVLVIVKERHDQLPRQIIKFCATAATAYGLWQGVRWIKWLYVLGFFLAAVFCVFIMPRIPQVPSAVMLLIAGLFAYGGCLLAFAPSVQAFFAWKRDDSPNVAESVEADGWLDDGCACVACGHPRSAGIMFCSQCGHRYA